MTVTAAQMWLLRAALRRGESALQAWQMWQSLASLDQLDEDSTWLLPLLYSNLSSQSIGSAEQLVRYENVYRHNWYKNHLMLHRARPSILRLQQHGAVVTLLGGCAMALGVYAQPAARPFERVMVATRPSAMADIGQHEQRCSWKDVTMATLAPAELLVDICLHRRTWDRRSQLLWLADAATLLQRHPTLDLALVAECSEHIGQSGKLREALSIVEEVFGQAVTA